MTAQDLFDIAFSEQRCARSAPYKEGCLYILRLKMGETTTQPHPYSIGTVESDAWFHGALEGHYRYQMHLQIADDINREAQQ